MNKDNGYVRCKVCHDVGDVSKFIPRKKNSWAKGIPIDKIQWTYGAVSQHRDTTQHMASKSTSIFTHRIVYDNLNVR